MANRKGARVMEQNKVNLYKALAAFQQEVPHVYKGTEGYGYSYADWGQTLDTINPYMAKHGLGFTQPLDGTKLKTIVFHIESGESIESSVDIPQDVNLAKMNAFQVAGSAITYYKRYSLGSVLGLITDADQDAAGEQVKPKATKEVRDRKAESAAGPEPMGQSNDSLKNAKADINDELIRQGYNKTDTKVGFIEGVLGKATIDSIDDAILVANALDDNGKE